jgi:uncharacterized protein YbjT (DUF2867 family)
MIYLITGATGDIGSRVVECLLVCGDGPRILVRDAEKARARYAQQNVGTGAWHARGESAIRASGIAFTFVQPAGFMSNAIGWATSIKAEGVVRAPTGDGRIAFIHPDDIAAVATKALTTQEYEGESLPITGPEALTYAEMTAKIGAAIGKPLRFQPISDEQERHQMIESGAPPEVVAAHVSIYRAIREGRLATVTDNVNRVVGRQAAAFDRWAQENAAACDATSCDALVDIATAAD